jgi:hypothetical protein
MAESPRSELRTTLTIVEILRDGGMDYATAVRILDEQLDLDSRIRLANALEAWEKRTDELNAACLGKIGELTPEQARHLFAELARS